MPKEEMHSYIAHLLEEIMEDMRIQTVKVTHKAICKTVIYVIISHPSRVTLGRWIEACLVSWYSVQPR